MLELFQKGLAYHERHKRILCDPERELGQGANWIVYSLDGEPDKVLKISREPIPSLRKSNLRATIRLIKGLSNWLIPRQLNPSYFYSPVIHGGIRKFDGDHHFFIIEKRSNDNLSQRLSDTAPENSTEDRLLRRRWAIAITDMIADLERAHIVHRDIKPGNILLDENQHPKLTDFETAVIPEPYSADYQTNPILRWIKTVQMIRGTIVSQTPVNTYNKYAISDSFEGTPIFASPESILDILGQTQKPHHFTHADDRFSAAMSIINCVGGWEPIRLLLEKTRNQKTLLRIHAEDIERYGSPFLENEIKCIDDSLNDDLDVKNFHNCLDTLKPWLSASPAERMRVSPQEISRLLMDKISTYK